MNTMERLIKHLRYSLILMGLLFSMAVKADAWSNHRMQDTIATNPNYDESLAKKLEGDDYGMKNYFLVAALPEYLPAADKIWRLKP